MRVRGCKRRLDVRNIVSLLPPAPHTPGWTLWRLLARCLQRKRTQQQQQQRTGRQRSVGTQGRSSRRWRRRRWGRGWRRRRLVSQPLRRRRRGRSGAMLRCAPWTLGWSACMPLCSPAPCWWWFAGRGTLPFAAGRRSKSGVGSRGRGSCPHGPRARRLAWLQQAPRPCEAFALPLSRLALLLALRLLRRRRRPRGDWCVDRACVLALLLCCGFTRFARNGAEHGGREGSRQEGGRGNGQSRVKVRCCCCGERQWVDQSLLCWRQPVGP